MTASPTSRRRTARLIAWVGLLCGAGGLVWRFVWPWTGTHADLVFIAMMVVSLGAILLLRFFD